MSTPTPHPASRNRWMNWTPKARILADTAEGAPTRTSETDSVVFVGDTSGEPPEIEAEPAAAEDKLENQGVSWAEWKAAALNRLFQEQGPSPGNGAASRRQPSGMVSAAEGRKLMETPHEKRRGLLRNGNPIGQLCKREALRS